jgi:hypothetical protein
MERISLMRSQERDFKVLLKFEIAFKNLALNV